MTQVRDVFADRDWIDHEVLRPLSHRRGNWELRWDPDLKRYEGEERSYAALLNELIDELEAIDSPARYHDSEDRLGECVQERLKWKVHKRASRWVGDDETFLAPWDYVSMLEQGSPSDFEQRELLLAAAGRIKAAVDHQQLHFDEMERSHQYMLAGILAAILFRRGG